MTIDIDSVCCGSVISFRNTKEDFILGNVTFHLNKVLFGIVTKLQYDDQIVNLSVILAETENGTIAIEFKDVPFSDILTTKTKTKPPIPGGLFPGGLW